MILYQLGILKEALKSFGRALIAPETMLVLLNERKQIRFHQPSLVEAAKEIRRSIDSGRLRIAEGLPNPPAELTEEVGRDLAQLLEAARREDGLVVRPRPLHKLGSFMNEEAAIGAYDDLLLSVADLEALLNERGDLESETHERASVYLRAQDQSSELGGGERRRLDRPLYIDDLALTFLRNSGLLPALERTELDLRIHPSVKTEQFALISSDQERQTLAESIGGIRTILRDALQAGHLGFLKWHRPAEGEEWVFQNAPTLSQLMREAKHCDAVSIDDRFLQRSGRLTDHSNRSIPVVCVLDVLQHLEVQGALSRERRHSKLHAMRAGGFACIPVEPEELMRYVLPQIRNDLLVETPELRVIRQSLARIRSLDIIDPAEASFLGGLQLAGVVVIRQLWADQALPVPHVRRFSDWIWHHVSPSPLDWLPVKSGDATNLVDAFVHHVGILFVPQLIDEERHKSFTAWIQECVLDPLLPANAEIVDRLARHIVRNIEYWSREESDEEESSLDTNS
jgi:hypothetical protein